MYVRKSIWDGHKCRTRDLVEGGPEESKEWILKALTGSSEAPEELTPHTNPLTTIR